jgi:hypothetical protein
MSQFQEVVTSQSVLGDCNSKCARTLNYYSVLFWMEIVNAPSQHGNGRVYGMDEDTFSFLSLTSYDPQTIPSNIVHILSLSHTHV